LKSQSIRLAFNIYVKYLTDVPVEKYAYNIRQTATFCYNTAMMALLYEKSELLQYR